MNTINRNRKITLTALAGLVVLVGGSSAQVLKKSEPAKPTPPKQQTTFQPGQIIDHSANLQQVSNVSIQMIAASSAQPPSVILRWVDNEWLPIIGYGVYRRGPGEAEFRKIATVKENQAALTQMMSTASGRAKAQSMAQLLGKARGTVTAPAPPKQEDIFVPSPPSFDSSKAAFEELRLYYQKVYTPYTGRTRANFDPPAPDSAPKAKSYYQKFEVMPQRFKTKLPKNAAAVKVAQNVPANPSVKQSTAAKEADEARAALIIGSLTSKQANEALGQGYVDKNVQVGETYEYRLALEIPDNVPAQNKSQIKLRTGVDPNMPIEIGGCTITVGADPQPAPVTGLQALQRDPKSVMLRWELDRVKSSARIMSYNVFRILNGKKTQINTKPVVIAAIADSKGNMIDPISYFSDSDVPVGPVSYEVVGVDSFGRETGPASLNFTMADWKSPAPVAHLKCDENNGAMTIYWLPAVTALNQDDAQGHGATGMLKVATKELAHAVAIDEAATYNIWRYDSEGSKVWTRLNDTPIPLGNIVLPTKEELIKEPSVDKIREKVWIAVRRTFVDNTAQKDNYYKYCITAAYPKNNLECAPSNDYVVGVPDPAPAPKVAGINCSYVPLVQQPGTLTLGPGWNKPASVPTAVRKKMNNLSVDPKVIKAQLDDTHTKLARAQNKDVVASGDHKEKGQQGAEAVMQPISGTVTLSNLMVGVQKATPDNSDLGGKVVLSWQPVALKAPVVYKIYRANATGYYQETPQAAITSEGKDIPGGGTTETAAAIRKPSGTTAATKQVPSGASSAIKRDPNQGSNNTTTGNSGINVHINPGVKINKLRYVERMNPMNIPDSEYALIAETDKPKYEDYLPKSRPMYYAYKVTAVSRWGMEGAAQGAEAHVLASLAPPTPKTESALPTPDGYVVLSWQPLAPEHFCAKYLIYRKPLQSDLSQLVKKYFPNLPQEYTDAAIKYLKRGTKAESLVAQLPPAPANNPLAQQGLQNALQQAKALQQEYDARLLDMQKSNDYMLFGEIRHQDFVQNGNTYVDKNKLIPNQMYTYVVVAQDIDNWKSDASAPQRATPFKVFVEPARNLQAVADQTQSGISLTWMAPATVADGYVVKRASGNSTDFIQVSGVITGLKFTDLTVMKGKQYTYQVLALDKEGNLSEPVTVKFTLPKPVVPESQ